VATAVGGRVSVRKAESFEVMKCSEQVR
jgi:hypothetical protein